MISTTRRPNGHQHEAGRVAVTDQTEAPGRSAPLKPSAGLELTYEMRRAVRQDVGHLEATVFDILAHHNAIDRDGVEMTATKLASEANVSLKSVRRAIGKLVKAGWITSENQFQNNRQLANRYYLHHHKVGGHSDRPGGHDDQPIGISSSKIIGSGVVLNSFDSVVKPGNPRAVDSREGLRPSGETATPENDSDNSTEKVGAVPVEGEDSAGRVKPRWRWPARDFPMPIPIAGQVAGGKRYLDIINNAMWLVSYFEGYVVDKANQGKVAKGQKLIDEIPEHRKRKWFNNAQTLVSEHPVWEVAEVIDWVFNTCAGHLAPWITENCEWPMDSKVTSIRQVEEVYDVLVEEMNSGVVSRHFDGPTGRRRSRINYNEPLPDPGDEAMVTELLELFTEFRLSVDPTKEIHKTRLWRWAKSFRIMLAHRNYEMNDLRMVITALRDHSEMDRTRYSDAYDLHRDGEWEHLVTRARLERLKVERRQASLTPTPVPYRAAGRGFQNWDEDAVCQSDCEPRSLDMANRPPKPPGFYTQNRSGDSQR